MTQVASWQDDFPRLSIGATSVPPGWRSLVLQLLRRIDALLDNGQVNSLRIWEIKERWGELHVYFTSEHASQEIRALIDSAAQHSLHTCQRCGRPGTLRDFGELVAVLCDDHAPSVAAGGQLYERDDGPLTPAQLMQARSLVSQDRKATSSLFGTPGRPIDPLFVLSVNALGFCWDRRSVPENVPVHSTHRVCFRVHRMLAEFVWAGVLLEGSSYTYAEVQTLLDGVAVGGHRLSEQAKVLSLLAGTKHLITLVRAARFDFSREVFTELNALVAPSEQQQSPLARVFDDGLAVLQELPPYERAIAFFLFAASHGFFREGNTRTASLMMNGILMSHGIDAICIPPARASEFKEGMALFRAHKEGTAMIEFLRSCHPDAASSGRKAEPRLADPGSARGKGPGSQ